MVSPRRARHDVALDDVVIRLPSRAKELASGLGRKLATSMARGDWTERSRAVGLPRHAWHEEDVIIQGWMTWDDFLPHEVRQRALRYAQHYEPLTFTPGSRVHSLSTDVFSRRRPEIVNSSWLLEQCQVRAQRVPKLVFPGVDSEAFRPHPLKAAPGLLRVAVLGRPDPWKGYGDLSAALDLGGLGVVDVHTFGGSLSPRTSTKWGSVTGHGVLSTAALADLYAAVDIVVTPSWYESFPLPPLEGMASGRAVITTDAGTSDYARDHENCLVVPTRDPMALHAALREALDPALRSAFGQAGRATAELMTWERGFAQFTTALGW